MSDDVSELYLTLDRVLVLLFVIVDLNDPKHLFGILVLRYLFPFLPLLYINMCTFVRKCCSCSTVHTWSHNPFFFFFFAICSARTSRSLRWSRPTRWSSANLHGCGELKWAPVTKGSVLGMRQSGPESPSHRERLCWAWTLSGELLKTFDISQKFV